MSCDIGEVTERLENEGWIMSCDVGEVTERLENELSFANPSVALPTAQLILQPLFRFSYVTSSSLSLPGEPPMSLAVYGKKTQFNAKVHCDRYSKC